MQRSDQELEPQFDLPPSKTRSICSSADDHQGVFNLFFFFFYRIFLPVRLPLIRQIKLACRKRRIPFICAHPVSKQCPSTNLSSGVAQIYQWPHFSRCNAIRHKQCQMLPAGLPDIDKLLRSTLPLQSWVDEVSAHILHQIIPPSSVRSDYYLPFFHSLDPCEFANWRKNKKLKTKKGNLFILGVFVSSFQPVVLSSLCPQSRGIIHTWTNDHIIDSLLLSWASNYSQELTSLKQSSVSSSCWGYFASGLPSLPEVRSLPLCTFAAPSIPFVPVHSSFAEYPPFFFLYSSSSSI